ncbi:hypothetical protein [Halococcus saccharolyticus]|uniref:Uncharacterized protein n=1 Tax=Halococcus saccharolyticus DSM 5350 TaxID=1227455 RepID=M0MBL7_9EURY|nr:hypothetical protein [Halococcus saccharolyticus]EMA42743.1 hypothetical protein C449_16413 [Halococcus saccharolyticus DSM 5350]
MDTPINRTTGRNALVVALIVGLVIGGTGVAAALSFTELNTEKISLFGAETASSDLNIKSQDTSVYSEDRMVVRLTAENTDTNNAHEANITVQVLDSSGNVASSISKDASVSSGSQQALTFDFNGQGVAQDYQRTYIIVDQTS